MKSLSTNSCIDILFLCLVRDCEATIHNFFAYLDRLEKCGFRCLAIIGENGSRDQTRVLIEQAAKSSVELVDTSFMAAVPARLTRMAVGRQALFEKAKRHGLRSGFVCVADLDTVMLEPPNIDALRKAIERLAADKMLFAIGATSRPVYYDLLSLIAEHHDYRRLNTELTKAKKRPLSYFRFHQRCIYAKQRQMTRPDPIPCSSSFNGLCIYKAEDYSLGTYRAPDEANVCEHVNLNLSICRATGRNMLITPDLVLRAPSDHAPVGLIRFYLDRMQKMLKLMSADRLFHFDS